MPILKLKLIEHDLILDALNKTKSVSSAARQLGTSRATLVRRIQRYQLIRVKKNNPMSKIKYKWIKKPLDIFDDF